MLVIRCARCKAKIWKYDKIGPGAVLRCHKARIQQVYNVPVVQAHKICCPKCSAALGIDKGPFYKMDPRAFIYNGTKRNR
ncbi:MAG: hypothetical protein E7K64_08945 [Clostridia bacterium]|uniref:Uncharacterized protein n=1 Tax=Peptococcus niger TaxID=2741 RepID=A0A1G6WNX0_PEPNI|nr:hypothetical protein [Peptococcus niger]MDU2292381.1 hypothetical protein [Peptococcus niger]MDU7244817.1 hypothetical protein [Clostridiales bacterium]MDU7506134.1 hypothetical protein [Clostridia bacterium]SDD67572.1 hypothetical protein SAMN04489866_105101 [Peptococcus niger]